MAASAGGAAALVSEISEVPITVERPAAKDVDKYIAQPGRSCVSGHK